jgi:hypothetical protein
LLVGPPPTGVKPASRVGGRSAPAVFLRKRKAGAVSDWCGAISVHSSCVTSEIKGRPLASPRLLNPQASCQKLRQGSRGFPGQSSAACAAHCMIADDSSPSGRVDLRQAVLRPRTGRDCLAAQYPQLRSAATMNLTNYLGLIPWGHRPCSKRKEKEPNRLVLVFESFRFRRPEYCHITGTPRVWRSV